MTTTKVVRTRLNNRQVSYAVAKHNGHKVPKDFKEWTWKVALAFLNGKTKKAKVARVDFEKVAGYPVPDGSFRDLITGRVTKVTKTKTSKKSKTSAKPKATPKVSEEPEAPKQAIKSNVTWKTTSKADELSQRLTILEAFISESEDRFSGIESKMDSILAHLTQPSS